MNTGTEPRATIVDMTPDGAFVRTPGRWKLWASGITVLAIAASVVIAALALLLWVTVALVPVVIAVGVVLYLGSRLRSWRRRGVFHHPVVRPT